MDGQGKPWPMSDDGDWCFRCGVPTVDRDGADDPCCWNCPGGGQDCREGRQRPGREQSHDPLANALALVASAAPGAELDALQRAAGALRPMVADGELELNEAARQLYRAGRRVGLADDRVKRAIEAGLA